MTIDRTKIPYHDKYSSEYPLLSSSEYQCRKRMGLLTFRTWFDVRWSPEFSVLASQIAGSARRSYPCLGQISWPETALSNAPIPDNASTVILNAASELLLPQTHFVARGGTLQRTHIWQRLGRHSQRCCGGRSDPSMGQNRQPFGDVHPTRRDGESLVTFKRRAEISSQTKKMCSSPASQGMQGVSFFAETEEGKQERMIFPEIAWRHTHQTLCRLAFTTEIPKQTDQWTVCDRDLLSDSFSRSCLDETEIQQNCITQVHTVTKPEPQHFVAAKHTMKTDQDAKRDVQAPLHARRTCNTTGPRWRDSRCMPEHLVSPPDFHHFPRVWNTPTQLLDEMMQDTQCAFSLSKVISSRSQLFHVFWKFLIQAKTSTRKNVCSKRFLVHRSDEDLTSLSKERSLHQWRIHRRNEILRNPWSWEVCVGSVTNGDTIQEQDSEKSVLLRSLSRRQSRD